MRKMMKKILIMKDKKLLFGYSTPIMRGLWYQMLQRFFFLCVCDILFVVINYKDMWLE
jgi:hypothetical protein